MALREYELNGATYQFDDSNVPPGAVLVVRTKNAPAPQNKARTAAPAKRGRPRKGTTNVASPAPDA